jgi:putative NADH-flavin reductase
VQRNENFNADAKRKADKSLTLGSKNITSIYTFEPDPKTGFGDFKDTQDALLFVFKGFSILGVADVAGAVIEIYVARGLRNNARLLYNLLEDGGLEDEMRELQERARPDKPEGLF